MVKLITPLVFTDCRRQAEGLWAQMLCRNIPSRLALNVSDITKIMCRFDTSHKTYSPAHFTLEIVTMLVYNRYWVVSFTPSEGM